MPQPLAQQPHVPDSVIRQEILDGRTDTEIAARYGITQQAVNRRRHKLGFTTLSTEHGPLEAKRAVNGSINALDNLNTTLAKSRKLLEACEEWLQDPDNSEKYYLGPRSGEVQVCYEVEIPTDKGYRTEKKKKKLTDLLNALEVDDEGCRISKVEKGEYKHADPRELILKTATEVRLIVGEARQCAQMLVDAKAKQFFRDTVIAEIAKCDPEAAARIAQAVRRSVALHGMLTDMDVAGPQRPAIEAEVVEIAGD